MPISNDEELVRAVAQVDDLIRAIQDYCGRENRADAKIKFPRGVMRTAESYRVRLPDYLDREKRSNCAYSFMFLDVLWWLSVRTDISSVGKQMVLKSAIVTLGTVLEACLYVPGLPKTKYLSNLGNAGAKDRIENTHTRGWISETERDCLKQLWDHRTNVHQKKIQADSELDLYSVDHVNAPYAALLNLLTKLKEWNGKDG
ncbi:hypothetical protein JQ617_24270 [Bradyrhizobium sp. KB893862 SZCCT0404]|uniref:hypothetical protein n=1 Tax=Bradyrhizobium sp. KB893862 SZCCT0404 TaxID=2807672 RepID=UPI001BA70118|nr:hypothetical protein [Bradyrhizobium sp. KB893862 SZCCT0404]MBR1177090.1 hypothetical protein [Bradyrhizobium sp. KB893862 SZCCT0404]